MESKHYDVFISYRYNGIDGMYADAVHKAIERFVVPVALRKKLPKGKKWFMGRIFQDKLELSASSDLWENIKDALEKTDYLILICTPRTKEESWCTREVEEFVRVHGKDKVLLVLAEGEPADSFPDILCKDGMPFAADMRTDNPKKIKKKVKSQINRILAPFFGLDYEELSSRHIERKWRKRVIFLVFILAIAITNFNFLFKQFHTIKTQKNVIEKELLDNVTYIAKDYEDKALYLDGISSILELLPDKLEHPSSKYSDALLCLTDLSGIYESGLNYVPQRYEFDDSVKVEMIEKVNDRYFLGMPFQTDKIIVQDIKNNKKTDIVELAIDDTNVTYVFTCCSSGNNFYYIDANGLNAYSCVRGRKIWTTETSDTEVMAANENYIICTGEKDISVFDTVSGELLENLALSKIDENLSFVIKVVCIDNRAYVFYVDNYGNVYAYTSGKKIKLYEGGTYTFNIVYDEVENAFYITDTSLDFKQTFLKKYDADSFENIYDFTYDFTDLYRAPVICNDYLYLPCLSKIYKMDKNTGEIIDEHDFYDSVYGIYFNTDGTSPYMEVIEGDGTVLTFDEDFNYLNNSVTVYMESDQVIKMGDCYISLIDKENDYAVYAIPDTNKGNTDDIKEEVGHYLENLSEGEELNYGDITLAYNNGGITLYSENDTIYDFHDAGAVVTDELYVESKKLLIFRTADNETRIVYTGGESISESNIYSYKSVDTPVIYDVSNDAYFIIADKSSYVYIFDETNGTVFPYIYLADFLNYDGKTGLIYLGTMDNSSVCRILSPTEIIKYCKDLTDKK